MYPNVCGKVIKIFKNKNRVYALMNILPLKMS